MKGNVLERAGFGLTCNSLKNNPYSNWLQLQLYFTLLLCYMYLSGPGFSGGIVGFAYSSSWERFIPSLGTQDFRKSEPQRYIMVVFSGRYFYTSPTLVQN